MNNRPMRLTFFLLASFLLPLYLSAQLASLDPTADLADFEEQLEEYMTDTGNRRAKDAYANFNGSLYGGGFTPEQQQRIVRSTVGLAAIKSKAETGMADFLDLHTYLEGADKTKQLLFKEFHGMLDTLLAQPELSPTQLNATLANALVYFRDSRLDRGTDPYGWKVAGGKPHFIYADYPILRIDTVQRLRASTQGDSLTIEETQLYVNLSQGTVTGKGGRTDWQRVGLPSDIFVRLVDYHFATDRQLLTSDSAQFQYPEYFGDRILYGTFRDRLQSGGPRVNGDVPEFISTNGYIDIDNVGEGMTLNGKFELRASRVYAVGEEGRRARVTLTIADGQDGRQLTGKGQQFIVENGERITAQKTELTVFFGEDSLYHPSISIDVDVPSRVAELKRTDSSADQFPFYHSGNNFNIDANNITMYLSGDSAVVGRRTVSFQEKGDVIFESRQFFTEQDYARIQALAGFNPLEVIYRYRYGIDGGSDVMAIDDLAGRFQAGLTGKDIQSVIFDLQDRGFLTYDTRTDSITLKDKLAHFVLSKREAKDYDRLRIVSRTQEENAFIDLKEGIIRVDGVRPLQLNPEKQIAIKPSGEQVSIVGDRNVDFGGQVYAGGVILSGKDFHFKYDPYYIQFDSVDYIDLFLPEGGEITEGGRRLSTASRIENVSGYLLIDAPRNKSGSENIAYFPSLQTRGASYIYYDRADTNSLYSRDSFYFELAPFSLNNLDSLTEFDLGLEGELVSGGIFPPMKQKLSLQEDGSLGFVGKTDSLGQSAYGDRGSYTGELTLNNTGLIGKGKFDYLDAEIVGEEIVFGVDSTTTSAKAFRLNRSTDGERSVPDVIAQSVDVTFRPYGDSMVVRPLEDAKFEMYAGGDKTFDGTLVLTPEALRGGGTFDWALARLHSESYMFSADGVAADTATLEIKSQQNPEEIALRAADVNAKINFDAEDAAIANNADNPITEMPYLEYVTSSDHFDWNMKDNQVTFHTGADRDRFTSTQPDQDSLTFTGKSAVYDNLTSELAVAGVPFVISADAKIIPGDSALLIQPGAQIAQLTDARIVADTANEYHVINRATVDIAGRKEYTASGFYEYNVGEHQQEFELQDIVGTRIGKGLLSVKETATRAEGEIAESTTFYIDDKTRFYGTIELDAGSKELAFDGYARIEAEELPSAEWFVVESEGDKNNLILNTEDLLGVDAKPLNTGFFLSKPQRQIYPSLIQTLQRRVDHPILDAEGVFLYDEDRDAFLFGDSARVNNPTELLAGNLMIYDRATKLVTGDGLMGVGGRLKYISLKSYGTISMELPAQFAREPEPEVVSLTQDEPDEEAAEQDSTDAPETLTDNMFLLEEEAEPEEALPVEGTVDAATATARIRAMNRYPAAEVEIMAAIDLILPERLVQIMATDIVSGGYSAPQLAINQKVPFATAGLLNLFPESPERAAAISGLPADAIDLPPAINQHTFLFSDLRMRWNSDYQSFVTTHQNNGLVSVRGQSVNRRIQSFMEVKMTTGGEDRLYLYVKSPSELFYFFGFKDGILNVASNNNAFMTELRNTKPKDLVLEMEDGETYEILEVAPGTASTFLRRVQTAFTAN